MVTKDYLDEKLADLIADLNIFMRKGNAKPKTLVGIPYNKHIKYEKDIKRM